MNIEKAIQHINSHQGIYIVSTEYGTGAIKAFREAGYFLYEATILTLKDLTTIPLSKSIVVVNADRKQYDTRIILQEHTKNNTVVLLVYRGQNTPVNPCEFDTPLHKEMIQIQV